MNKITSTDIAHLASLSRLELTEGDQVRFAGQLGTVIEYVEQLSAVDTSSVTEIEGASGLHNVFAQDVLREETDQLSVSKEDLLSGVPAVSEDFIEVRAVMNDEIVGA